MIWGAGSHTEMLYHATSFFSADREYLLVDRDPAKVGGSWRGIPIVAPGRDRRHRRAARREQLPGPARDRGRGEERGVEEVVALYDEIRVH